MNGIVISAIHGHSYREWLFCCLHHTKSYAVLNGQRMETIVGFVIAAIVGITGIGGGSFTTPALVLLAGLPASEAVGTAMVFAAVLRLLAAPFYMARKHVDLRYLRLLLVGAVPGLLFGTWLLRIMRTRSWSPVALLVIGLMLAISSALTFAPRLRQPRFAGERGGWLSVLALPIGVETGFSSAGAGALGTILLLNFSELATPAVVGTDILFGIVLTVVGSVFHLGWGSINSLTLIKLLAGGIPGVLLGCVFSGRVPAERLRTAIAVVAIALGLQLVWMGGAPLVLARIARQDRPTLQPTISAAALALNSFAVQCPQGHTISNHDLSSNRAGFTPANPSPMRGCRP